MAGQSPARLRSICAGDLLLRTARRQAAISLQTHRGDVERASKGAGARAAAVEPAYPGRGERSAAAGNGEGLPAALSYYHRVFRQLHERGQAGAAALRVPAVRAPESQWSPALQRMWRGI